MNCWVEPLDTGEFAGVTAMETRAGAVTVNVVEPFTEPDVAVIVLVP